MQLLVGDIEVVSSEEAARIQSGSLTNQVKTLNVTKPIQVDVNDPILSKATKLDHLCTVDRDYFLLESDTVSAEEYAKLSLGSETTDDSHVQQLSLPHCDDSLSTTVSEESDCTAAVRVYDLNKRETKILRHDIIKRSRIPIGGDSINSLHNLGNCCSETITTPTNEHRSNSPLQNTIQQLNSHLLENVNEARKPPRSPTKLKSVHLNRNPRKLKMADVQLMNDAFGTSLDPKIVDEIKRKNGETEIEIETSIETKIEHDDKKAIATATEQLLENERVTSSVRVDVPEQCQDNEIKRHSVEITISSDKTPEILVNESANGNDLDGEDVKFVQNIENNNIANAEESCIAQNSEHTDSMPSPNETAHKEIVTNVETDANVENDVEHVNNGNHGNNVDNGNNEDEADHVREMEEVINQLTSSIESEQRSSQVKKYERSYEVIVKVNEHKERSVIEEDVISALPSVKELARSFSTKRDERPQQIQRPKVSVICNSAKLSSHYMLIHHSKR